MSFVSYAQNFEDVMLRRALAGAAGVERGFYIDVGANDPIVDSVTQAFYERGWHGINIEPMRDCHQRLVVARPRDINLPVAVGDTGGSITFFNVPGTGLSTTDAGIARQHAAQGHTVVEEQVEVMTLAQVCERHVAGPIHFLKVDVEGFEAQVLRGMDFARWRPWVVMVEATRPQSQERSHADWEPILLEAGYRRAWFDGLNQFYVADEHAQLAAAFDAPPNFFDSFQLRAGHHYAHPGMAPPLPVDEAPPRNPLTSPGRFDAYLPFVEALARLHPRAPVLDLHCGRGDWLALLREMGVPARGIAVHEAEAAACRERGLDTVAGEPGDPSGAVMAVLRATPDASLAAVTCLHIADHVPATIADIAREAQRALRPGGLLLLQAPNPENLLVAGAGFYENPAHRRPVAPRWLAQLPLDVGFARSTTLRLHEPPHVMRATGPHPGNPLNLLDVLSGVSPNYAVIALKPGGAADDALDAAFARPWGVTLEMAAARYEQDVARRARRISEVTAAEAERRSQSALQRAGAAETLAALSEQRAVDAEQRALQAEQRALAVEVRTGEMMALQNQILLQQEKLHAMHASTSWRMTKPVRWLSARLAALRGRAPVARDDPQAMAAAGMKVHEGVRDGMAARAPAANVDARAAKNDEPPGR